MVRTVDAGSASLPLRFAEMLSTLVPGLGRRSPLSLEQLRRRAEKITGIADWGPPSVYLEGQARLIDAINSEANLSPLGRRFAEDDLVGWLSGFLRLRRHPPSAATAATFRKPLFIIGWARTGSTLLHHLLAQVEAFRAPKFWELDEVYIASSASDDAMRQRRAARKLGIVHLLAPAALDIHPIRADGPDECHYLLEPTFVSPQYCLFYHVPSYWSWVRKLSDGQLQQVYELYRSRAAQLALNAPDKHWLSKTLIHLYFAPVLPTVFPDCRIIWLRREGCQAIPSFCSLILSYRRLFSRVVSPRDIGNLVMDVYEQANQHITRAMTLLPSGQSTVLEYEDLVADPVNAVRGICATFDYSFTPADEARVRQELNTNMREHRSVRHVYSADDYGLAKDKLAFRMEV